MIVITVIIRLMRRTATRRARVRRVLSASEAGSRDRHFTLAVGTGRNAEKGGVWGSQQSPADCKDEVFR